MELINAYKLSRIEINHSGISIDTFHHMRMNDWYYDSRSNDKFILLNKRVKVDDQFYRVLVRFEKENGHPYSLSVPCPFLITECEEVGENKWKDTKTYHGRSLKSVLGYLLSGVPDELIVKTYNEIKYCIRYI